MPSEILASLLVILLKVITVAEAIVHPLHLAVNPTVQEVQDLPEVQVPAKEVAEDKI